MVPRTQSHGLPRTVRSETLRRAKNGTGRRTPGVLLTIAVLLALSVSACAFPEESFDGSLEGTYYVNGFDQRDVEYSGHLTITTTDDPSVYGLQWIITGSVQAGTGTVEGDKLLVDWTALEGYDTSSQGTAVYEITANGELHGERLVTGQEGIGTEEALPIR